MKHLFIFATILLVASCDKIIDEQHPCVTVSDSQPVKFWPSDCETYNEEQICGIHPKCWCLPYQCDDPVPVQIQSDEESEVEENVSQFVSDLDDWFNTANGVTPGTGGSTADWAWSSDLSGSAKITTVNTFGTKFLRLSGVSMPQQQSYVRIKFSIPASRNSSNLKLSFIIRNASNAQVLNEDFGATSTGSEQSVDIPITNPIIWTTANHFLISTGSTAYVAGDVIHITEISYLFMSPLQYSLKAYDKDDNELFDIPLEYIGSNAYMTSFVPSDYEICEEKIQLKIFSSSGKEVEIDPLQDWVDVPVEVVVGDPIVWDTGPNPHIELVGTLGSQSDLLMGEIRVFGSPPYNFDYDITNVSPGSNYLFIKAFKDGVELGGYAQITLINGSNVGTIELDPIDTPDHIALQMEVFDGNFDVTINSFEPSGGATEDTERYKSDCLDIRVKHDCSNLISYSNTRNIDGLVYSGVSPQPEFFIRVPSVFFHQRFPTERFSTYDTGDVIHLSGNVKRQKLFETDYMPYYMHEKLNKIFEHQLVLIGNQYWTSEEEYEIEEGNKRWPIKKASTYLTQRNSFQQFVM